MDQEIVVTIIIVAGIVLVIGHIGRLLRASLLHRTVRMAIKQDNLVSGELIERLLDQKVTSRDTEARNGLILIALAAAIFGYGLLQTEAEAVRSFAGTSLFPLFIGAALMWRGRKAGDGGANR